MKVFLSAIATAIVVAVAAPWLLDRAFQVSAYQAFVSGPHVQFSADEAGHNLVGKDWYSSKSH